MAYVKDHKTGKFTWVEGAVGDDDRPFVSPDARIKQSGPPPATWLIALGVIAAVALVVSWTMKTLADPAVAIRRIHNHPAEFDGRQIMVRGKVGEVFRMGGSYAYYLLQGRDTLVVFTRDGHPQPNTNTRVEGSVSIGYLDGIARPALFAN